MKSSTIERVIEPGIICGERHRKLRFSFVHLQIVKQQMWILTVLSGMSHSDFHTRQHSNPVYRVEVPRASDAIGSALRDAFVREIGLPDDMAAMLARLNGKGSPRH